MIVWTKLDISEYVCTPLSFLKDGLTDVNALIIQRNTEMQNTK